MKLGRGKQMRVGIIGVGIVGSATAEVLKEHNEVYLYDKYKEPWNTENHLQLLADHSEVVFICVPSPMKKSGGVDCSDIYNSISSFVKRQSSRDTLIVIRSTVVPGTTNKLADEFEPYHFTYNPEFLKQETALEDMKNTKKIVLGVESDYDEFRLSGVFRPVFPNAKYITTDRKTAEMIKYMSNVMLAGQISLANELCQICDIVGVDYNEVKDAVLLDERIGKNIDVPGPDGEIGFGGRCLPKDLNALIYLSRELGYRPYLLEEVWRLNKRVRESE